MKQVFVLFRTDANNVKQIKEVYLERDKAQGELVYKILKDNQDEDSKTVYSFEPMNVYTRPAKAKKANSKASSNGRTPVAKTFDTAKA